MRYGMGSERWSHDSGRVLLIGVVGAPDQGSGGDVAARKPVVKGIDDEKRIYYHKGVASEEVTYGANTERGLT